MSSQQMFSQTRGIKLDIGYSFFNNNLDEIKRSLFPIAPFVHKIHAVNGRCKYYNAYPGSNFSYEDSALIETLPNAKVYYYTGAEHEKRQVYLDAAVGADFLLVLDTDEWIYSVDWTKLYEELEFLKNDPYLNNKDPYYLFRVNIYFHKDFEVAWNNVNPETWQTYDRLIRNPTEIQYDLTHYSYTKKQDDYKHNWLSSPSFHKLQNLTIQSSSNLRNRHVLDFRKKWKFNLTVEESQSVINAVAKGIH